MADFFFMGQSNAALSATAVRYSPLYGINGVAFGFGANADSRAVVIPHAMTLDQLRVAVDVAPGVGKSFAVKLIKNGSATTLTTTISDSNLTAQDTTHSVALVAGDLVVLQITPTGTPTVPNQIWWSLKQSTSSLFGVSNLVGSTPSTASNSYIGLFSGDPDTTEAVVSNVMPTAGTLKNLYLDVSTIPGIGKSWTATLMVNSVASALTAAVTDSNTQASDVASTVSVAAGDIVSIRFTPSGTPTFGNPIRFGISFDPTVAGESFIANQGATPSSTLTNYSVPEGVANFTTTETDQQLMVGAMTLKALYVSLGGSPGSGKSFTFTARDNQANTAAAVTVSNANTTGNITGQTITLATDDLVSIASVPAGTPSANRTKHSLLFGAAAVATTTSTSSSTSSTSSSTSTSISTSSTSSSTSVSTSSTSASTSTSLSTSSTSSSTSTSLSTSSTSASTSTSVSTSSTSSSTSTSHSTSSTSSSTSTSASTSTSSTSTSLSTSSTSSSTSLSTSSTSSSISTSSTSSSTSTTISTTTSTSSTSSSTSISTSISTSSSTSSTSTSTSSTSSSTSTSTTIISIDIPTARITNPNIRTTVIPTMLGGKIRTYR